MLLRSNSIKSGSGLPFSSSLESLILPPRSDTVRRIISTVITSISGGSSPNSSLKIGPQTEVDASEEAVMKLKHWETSGKSSRSNSLTKDDDDSVFSGLNFSQSEEHDISEHFASLAIISKKRRNSFIFVEYSASKDEVQKDNQGLSSIFDPLNLMRWIENFYILWS